MSLHALDAAGESLVRWVLWMNLWGVLLLAGAATLDLILRRRISAAWRLALYAPLVIRLALPVSWAAPVAWVEIPAPAARETSAPPTQALTRTPPSAAWGPSVTNAAQDPPSAAASATTWYSIAPVIYLAGLLLLAGIWAHDLLRLRALVHQSRPLPSPAGAVPLRVHPEAGPVLVGVRRPIILIPQSLAHDASAKTRAHVLRHELAHLARRDHWLAAFLHLVVIACWPILPLWIAAARCRALMEQAADEHALQGRPASHRAEYARALLDVADQVRSAAGRRLAVLMSPGFGRGVRARLRALSYTRRWPAAAQVALVLPLSATLLACAGGSASRHDDDAVPGARVRLTVLSSWPDHPALPDWNVAQRQETPADDQPVARAPGIATLTPDQARDIAARGHAVADPQILIREGGRSSIRIAHEGMPSALTDGFNFSVHVVEASRERTVLKVDYREMSGGQSIRWHNTGEIAIPAGRSGVALVTGFIGTPFQLLLITPELATMPPGEAFNPADPASYPAVMHQVWLYRLPERVTFETLVPDAPAAPNRGSLITKPAGAAGSRLSYTVPPDNRDGPIPWARVLPQARLAEYLRAIGDRPGARHLSSPAAISRLGSTARIAPDTTDKAGSTVGDHGFTIDAKTAGDSVRLTVKHTLRDRNGKPVTLSTLDDWTLRPDEVVSWIQPPAVAGDDHWYIVTVSAELIPDRNSYPFQTSGGLPPK